MHTTWLQTIHALVATTRCHLWVWSPQMKELKINIRQLSEIYGILKNELEWAELLCLSVSAPCQIMCIDKSQWIEFLIF